MAVRHMLIADRYRLLEPVGTGGMGRVWLARDEMLDRDVAVKEFVPPDWLTDDEKDKLRTRTLREARSAARLNHPHVVRIYDVVHAENLPWIVMEYVPSRSLYQAINEDGPFSPSDAARIGLDVLDALTAAHRAGVLHRDVKPHNVLIGHDGRVVLTDFGLATFVDDGSVTSPGLVVGSPQYVSPERARDGASTVEADLWSLGATLYASVEGRSPYARESAMATLIALSHQEPDPPVLAGSLEPVLMGLLRREPTERLTGDEVAYGLRDVLIASTRPVVPSPRRPESPVPIKVSQPVAEPPPPVARRPWARLAVLGVAVIVLLAVGGASVAVWKGHGDDRSGAMAAVQSSSSAAIPAAANFSPSVCGTPAPAGLPSTPQPGAARSVNGWALYADYSYFTGPSGFHLAVPDGWTYQAIGTTLCFRDPTGTRYLSIDPARNPAGDPLKACRAEAKKLVDAAALPAYKLVGLSKVPLQTKAADWEFTYQGPEGLAMHAMTRWFSLDGQAFALGWATREFDWQINLSIYAMMKSTFYVAAPSGREATPSPVGQR
jgi:tRNA A-37 threonylcarbamoyl transferase component Bud32